MTAARFTGKSNETPSTASTAVGQQNCWRWRGSIPNRKGIELRPSVVDRKERFGDLEIDTVIGKNKKGALLTINDRAGMVLWIRKLNGKNAEELAKAAVAALRSLKKLGVFSRAPTVLATEERMKT